ncbi:GTP-binding protein [Devosia limi]|uniref:Small GTP-binding protein domain-containing protein n=1 Tax=Devosia limi DSM 17137 TaxID=1121477 RepID=A0A1M4U1Z1_9HYPH|nr:small GTP-binding protein domain-containing protein [Devosia limi DSM 17137]
MRALNLGILAHIDAGKTSLTERLLFDAGVIDAMGSVDRGNTQTDTMALERQRGITIRSAVASFVVNDVTINLIDTPGHPDFIAEVERTLACLDAVVLVVSAVEGVQAQTRVLMRTLQRLQIPTLIFVNKIDRMGADPEGVVARIADKLTPAILPMQRVVTAGERGADVVTPGATEHAFVSKLAEALAENDAAVLEAVIADRALPYADLQRSLAQQTGAGQIHPIFFGSAMTGVGIASLMAGITGLLPVGQGDAAAELSGIIFKIDRGPAGEKIAYVRLFSGVLHARERLQYGNGHHEKVTAISMFDRGWKSGATCIAAGQIGQIRGLVHARVGDAIGANPRRRATALRPLPSKPGFRRNSPVTGPGYGWPSANWRNRIR